ncbi:hypothetical protein CRE_16497 [Caenorhabditis remanei]|uniref:F-box associated domain-containing protein n=1 Tax=Caenorhabditis remanei TaxID=31234 RepID=E3NM74_CAERE|nr:hypothetical protein CRE_16497 [Caenorhabditis remanei]
MTCPFPLFRFLFWIISVFIQTVKSLLISNIPLPPPHFPPKKTSPVIPDVPSISVFLLPEKPLCHKNSTKSTIRWTFLCFRISQKCVIPNFSKSRLCVQCLRLFMFIKFRERKLVKMNGQYVPIEVHRSDEYLVSYWEKTSDGLEVISDYVTDLFNIDVSEVCVSKNAIKMIEWVIKRQKTLLESVTVYGVTSSEEELIYYLRDCTTSSQIEIRSYAPPNFRFSGNFRRIDFLYTTCTTIITAPPPKSHFLGRVKSLCHVPKSG